MSEKLRPDMENINGKENTIELSSAEQQEASEIKALEARHKELQKKLWGESFKPFDSQFYMVDESTVDSTLTDEHRESLEEEYWKVNEEYYKRRFAYEDNLRARLKNSEKEN